MTAFGRAIAATVILAWHAPATAADIASIRPLGFSANGDTFAFEQFGIQDGSGFPYADIFVIDTIKDKYLPGTPIRVRLDDETRSLAEARSIAMEKAAPFLDSSKFAADPGQWVAFNPVSELSSPAHELRYVPFPTESQYGTRYTLTLETFTQPAPVSCKDRVDEVAGFRLQISEDDKPESERLVYEDKSIPGSRNCPSGYRLGGVVTHFPFEGPTLHMVLVMTYSFGFEGQDGRWIAIPVRP